MTRRTEPHDMDEVLAEKNAVILSLTDQNVALKQRVDQLTSDLTRAEQLIERIRLHITGIKDAPF